MILSSGRLYSSASIFSRYLPGVREVEPAIGMNTPPVSYRRHFAFQPICTPAGDVAGYEALFRAGWEDRFSGDPNLASRIMVDNWLLFGFEEFTAGQPVFLNCTRDTLTSGLLTLLPPSTVIEILETVEPDEQVLSACRRLKESGYRIALDDFERLEGMEKLLELADFVKVDFRLSGPEDRARLLPGLRRAGPVLIAEKVESEEELRLAAEDGFALAQGYYFKQRATCVANRDPLDPVNCMLLLAILDKPVLDEGRLVDLIDFESGIEARLLRRANWIAPAGQVVNSVREAIALLGRQEMQKLVTLAMTAATDVDVSPQPAGYDRQSSIKEIWTSRRSEWSVERTDGGSKTQRPRPSWPGRSEDEEV